MRILLFSYYFPPQGGAGSIRWAHLIRELGQEHDITVIAPQPDPNAISDMGLLEIIDGKCDIVRTPTPGLWSMVKGRRKGLSAPSSKYIFLPDSRFWWIERAVKAANTLGRPDVIIATSPPFSAAVAGMKTANHFDVPFVLDMRDSFLNDPNTGHLPEFHRKRRERLSKMVMERANAVITVNPIVKTEMQVLTYHEKPVRYIPNGYDPISPHTCDGDIKTISLTGRFFRYLNNPEVILDAISEDQRYKVRFIGPSEGALEEKIESLSIQNRTTITGSVPYDRVRQELAESDLHFLYLDGRRGNSAKIPSKVWDFLSTGLPIVACASPISPILGIIDGRGVISKKSPEAILGNLNRMVDFKRVVPSSGHLWSKRAEEISRLFVRSLKK